MILTFSSYRPILREIRGLTGTEDDKLPPVLLAWAVVHAARFVPAATCLTQALALRRLLALSGQPCLVRIGVTENPAGSFEAHAWVMSKGRVLLGGIDEKIERFVPIVDL